MHVRSVTCCATWQVLTVWLRLTLGICLLPQDSHWAYNFIKEDKNEKFTDSWEEKRIMAFFPPPCHSSQKDVSLNFFSSQLAETSSSTVSSSGILPEPHLSSPSVSKPRMFSLDLNPRRIMISE